MYALIICLLTLGVPQPDNVNQTSNQAGGSFTIGVQQNVMVPMRDGSKLATDIYYPMKNGNRVAGRLPAVLMRSPYDKENELTLPMVKFFAQHGYLSVIQDCRGRYKSEGGFFLYHEAEDGCDTVEWLASHKWCNGKVGMHGSSSPGWAQIAAATQAPKGLVTIIPHAGTTNAYHDSLRIGGVPHVGMFQWLLGLAATSPAAQQRPGDAAGVNGMIEELSDFLEWAYRTPWRRGATPLAKFPVYEDAAFQLFFRNNTYTDFWKTPSLAPELHFDNFPDIPVLWVSGWWDRNVGTMTAGYEGLHARNRNNQYLLMGPWMHSFQFSDRAGDFKFSSEEAPASGMDGFLHLQLAWFDRWLKGDKTVDLGAKVRYFVMGGGDGSSDDDGFLQHGGRWVSASVWPPTGSVTRLYLRDGGRLTKDAPQQQFSSTSYRYDPRKTVNSMARGYVPVIPFPEGTYQPGPRVPLEVATLPGHCIPGRRIMERNDVISFQTEPLTDDVEIVGNINVRFWVGSDAPDTDFHVRLLDLYPSSEEHSSGFAFPVTDGMLRARYRDSFENPALMTPGGKYQLNISLEPTANVFKAGHRIQIYICSSNFPDFAVNRNNADLNDHTPRIAKNTVFHELEYASYIELPVVKKVGHDNE